MEAGSATNVLERRAQPSQDQKFTVNERRFIECTTVLLAGTSPGQPTHGYAFDWGVAVEKIKGAFLYFELILNKKLKSLCRSVGFDDTMFIDQLSARIPRFDDRNATMWDTDTPSHHIDMVLMVNLDKAGDEHEARCRLVTTFFRPLEDAIMDLLASSNET